MMDKLIAMNRNLRISILLSGFFASTIIMFISGDYWLLFFILSWVFLGLLISSNVKYDENLRNNFDKLAKHTLSKNHFNYDEFHIGDNKLSAIAMNEQNEKLAILHRKSLKDSFTFSPVDFSNIIESSIVEDGETVIRASKGSIVGGALVGSIIAGGIGATVGAISADRTSRDKVKKISLMIVVNDLKNPIYEINFMNTVNPIDKLNPMYKTRHSQVNKWHKMISIILKRNELNSKSV